MLKKLLNLFNYNQQLIEKTDWEVTNESGILQWSKRGIANGGKDLKFRKYFCYSLFGIFLLFILFMFFTVFKFSNSLLFQITLCVGIVFFVMPLIMIAYFGMFEVKFYSYRITKEKIELVSWKEDLLFGKQVSKGLLWIVSPFLFIVFITEPTALLVSLGGMAGVGILAGATLFSKGYIESHLNYQHMITQWDSLLKIEIDNRGKPIILVWGKDFYDKKHDINLFNLFCTQEIFDEIVKLIQQQVKEEELEKGIHYCETWG